MRRMRRQRRPRSAGILTVVTALLLAVLIAAAGIAGCSAVNVLNDGGSAGEVIDAIEADAFGEKEQVYTQLSVSLPRHSGYALTEDKTAYATLKTDEERAAYEAIETSVFRVTEEPGGSSGRYALQRIILPDLTSGEILKVKEAVLADHPEVFWVESSYYLGYNFHDGNYMVLGTNWHPTQIEQGIDALETAVAQFLREIPSGLNEYDRELLIHDLLVRDIVYDEEAAANGVFGDSSTSYGALVEKKALCSGYALAAKLLLNRVGISCMTVKGVSNGEAHMWNIVSIDRRWYHLDVTWDDPMLYTSGDYTSYEYFNLTDDNILCDHTIADNYSMLTDEFIAQMTQEESSEGYFFNFDLPRCVSSAANFYELNSVPVDTLNEDGTQIIAGCMAVLAASEGDTIYLSFPVNMDKTVVEAWLDSSLVEAMGRSNRVSGGRKIASCTRSTKSRSGSPWNCVYTIRLVYRSED